MVTSPFPTIGDSTSSSPSKSHTQNKAQSNDYISALVSRNPMKRRHPPISVPSTPSSTLKRLRLSNNPSPHSNKKRTLVALNPTTNNVNSSHKRPRPNQQIRHSIRPDRPDTPGHAIEGKYNFVPEIVPDPAPLPESAMNITNNPRGFNKGKFTTTPQSLYPRAYPSVRLVKSLRASTIRGVKSHST